MELPEFYSSSYSLNIDFVQPLQLFKMKNSPKSRSTTFGTMSPTPADHKYHTEAMGSGKVGKTHKNLKMTIDSCYKYFHLITCPYHNTLGSLTVILSTLYSIYL